VFALHGAGKRATRVISDGQVLPGSAATDIASVVIFIVPELTVDSALRSLRAVRGRLDAFTYFATIFILLESVFTVHGTHRSIATFGFVTLTNFTAIPISLKAMFAFFAAHEQRTCRSIRPIFAHANFTSVRSCLKPVRTPQVAYRFTCTVYIWRLSTSAYLTSVIILLKPVFAVHGTSRRTLDFRFRRFLTLADITSVWAFLVAVRAPQHVANRFVRAIHCSGRFRASAYFASVIVFFKPVFAKLLTDRSRRALVLRFLAFANVASVAVFFVAVLTAFVAITNRYARLSLHRCGVFGTFAQLAAVFVFDESVRAVLPAWRRTGRLGIVSVVYTQQQNTEFNVHQHVVVCERERENLFAKSNNETNNSKQHKIQWQAAREA